MKITKNLTKSLMLTLVCSGLTVGVASADPTTGSNQKSQGNQKAMGQLKSIAGSSNPGKTYDNNGGRARSGMDQGKPASPAVSPSTGTAHVAPSTGTVQGQPPAQPMHRSEFQPQQHLHTTAPPAPASSGTKSPAKSSGSGSSTAQPKSQQK